MNDTVIEWFVIGSIFTLIGICTIIYWYKKYYITNKIDSIAVEPLYAMIILCILMAFLFFRIGIAKF